MIFQPDTILGSIREGLNCGHIQSLFPVRALGLFSAFQLSVAADTVKILVKRAMYHQRMSCATASFCIAAELRMVFVVLNAWKKKPQNNILWYAKIIQHLNSRAYKVLMEHRLTCLWTLYSCSHAAAAASLQSCPTLCDPIDGSPPGSTIPGILQARTLEWVAISFSNAWKWKVKGKSLSRDPMDCSPPGSSIHGIFQARVLEWGAIAFSSSHAAVIG